MNRGEVWWVEGFDTRRRPHLILTRQAAISVLNAVLAVPATQTIRGIPTEVELGPEDGMPGACVLTLDNLATIPRTYFVERICTLSSARLVDVCRALALASDCRFAA